MRGCARFWGRALLCSLLQLCMTGCSPKARCTDDCTKLARSKGDDGAFCASVCDSTCETRCADISRRVGGAPCDVICSKTCPELEKTYGMNDEQCQWLVNDVPSPTYTPRKLEP